MPDPTQAAPGEQERQTVPWRTATLFLITVVGVALCFGLLRTLLFPVTGAIVLAVGLRLPRAWMRRHMGPSATATVLLAALSLAVLLPGFFIVRSLTGEALTTAHYVQSGGANQDFHQLTARHQKIGNGLQKAVDQLTPDQAGQRMAGQAAVWFGRALGGLVSGVTELALMLFFLFFLLRDGERAQEVLASLIPLGDAETKQFLDKLGDLTYAVFVGRLLIAGIQGTLAGLAYWLLGVPGALLWTVLTALFCLVPAFGAFIAWIPIALYLGLADSWTKALILALWGGVVVGNIDNILYPILVGRKTSLHTAVIFVAIFGGVALFGIAGFALGPVAVAATMLLLEAWKERLGTTKAARPLP